MSLTIDLPRKCATIEGGQTDKMVLSEPQFRYVMISDKETEQSYAPHTIRARDIKLLSLVSRVTEADIRTLPRSVLDDATAFLRRFIDGETNIDSGETLLHFEAPIKDQNGQEYASLMLDEPTVGAMETAEKALKNGVNSYSIRQYQQVLISRSGDLPGALVPQLPISIVSKAAQILKSFRSAGPATGET